MHSRIMVLMTSTELQRLRKTIHVALAQQLLIRCVSCSTPRTLLTLEHLPEGIRMNSRIMGLRISTEVPRLRKTIHVA